MKLQVLSDLHNEFLRSGRMTASHSWRGEIPATEADIIVLAGDIDVGVNGVHWMMEESIRLTKPVIYVLGNHEFYRHEYFSLKQAIRDKAEGTNVSLLDCGCFESDHVRILGVTLWTDYSANKEVPRDLAMFYAGRSMTDHKIIQFDWAGNNGNFKPADALSLHEAEKQWLEGELQKPFQGKTVVVSHHAPHPVCVHPTFPNSPIGPAFYSNLEELIVNHNIDLWIYGHTHSNLDTVINGTRIVSNQAGYPGENVKNFDPRRIIEI